MALHTTAFFDKFLKPNPIVGLFNKIDPECYKGKNMFCHQRQMCNEAE